MNIDMSSFSQVVNQRNSSNNRSAPFWLDNSYQIKQFGQIMKQTEEDTNQKRRFEHDDESEYNAKKKIERQ